jgi:hypothetical protein
MLRLEDLMRQMQGGPEMPDLEFTDEMPDLMAATAMEEESVFAPQEPGAIPDFGYDEDVFAEQPVDMGDPETEAEALRQLNQEEMITLLQNSEAYQEKGRSDGKP